MDVIDEEIYKCLDQLDTLLVKDLTINGEWKQEEENDEKKNSINCLNCIFKLIDKNDNFKSNSILILILKNIFLKHKRLFENLDYDLDELTDDDLPFSLRKYWRQIYPQLSRILIENLIQNDLVNLDQQFRFNEILEFFLLIERSNFWKFYEQIRKERLIVLSRQEIDLKSLINKLINTLDYEIYLVCNYRYIQNLNVEYSDFILIYSNIIKTTICNQLESIKNYSIIDKINLLLNIIKELNKFDKFIKTKSKLWIKLDLPNSINQTTLQWNYKDYFMKKDYFNFLLNELNKELNYATGNDDNDNYTIISIDNTKLISSFVDIIKILDKYNLIYIKQLKKAFTVLIDVNINQFIQIKYSKLLRILQLKDIYLYLNTLHYIKENFSNYGVDSSKVNELISDLESEFKSKHLFILNLNINHMEYYVCYLNNIKFNLIQNVNYNLFQSQKLYQDLLQESFIQLEERNLDNDDLIFLLSNLTELIMFTYDNEGLFIDYESPFKKILNKFSWKLLYRIVLLNSPLKILTDELSKFDDSFQINDQYDSNWLQYFNLDLYFNLSYYHALISNQKIIKHFTFICRPFLENNFKFTIDLINQLIKNENSNLKIMDKVYRKNRNRLLKSIFNLITTSITQLNTLSLIILPIIEDQTLNFDCIQFEILIDESLNLKHCTKLNQLDWIWSIVKLIKNLISNQFEIIFNSFLYKYIDLINLNQLDTSTQNLFNKLNLKFIISENYLLDEYTESIFKLVCDSLFIIPNGLFYSLELIAKSLKSNDQLIFNSLTGHIILFAICKQLKSRLKNVLDKDSFKIFYSKIINNLLAYITFPEDHDLNKYRNKFNDLLLRRKINLNVDYIKMNENEELESLFRLIEINYDNYSNDIDLLDKFLLLNSNYLNTKLNNQEFNDQLILNTNTTIDYLNMNLNLTNIYKKCKFNFNQSQINLKSTFNYYQLLRIIRIKTNKTFIKNNLIKRSDFIDDSLNNHEINDLKKIFQIN